MTPGNRIIFLALIATVVIIISGCPYRPDTSICGDDVCEGNESRICPRDCGSQPPGPEPKPNPNPQPKCTDDCSADSRKCFGNAFMLCGNFDGDSCLEWSQPTSCSQNETCNEGRCERKPEPVCGDGRVQGRETCEFDSECQQGNVCSACQCKPATQCGNNKCEEGETQSCPADCEGRPQVSVKAPEGKVNEAVSLSAEVSGGKAPYTYNWRFAGIPEPCTIENATGANPALKCTFASLKKVKVDVKGADGKTSVASASVTVIDTTEDCSNGLDDDSDGAMDCEDSQCSGDDACRALSCGGYGQFTVQAAGQNGLGKMGLGTMGQQSTTESIVASLTEELIEYAQKPASIVRKSGEPISVKAQRRSELMLELAESDPGAFLANVIAEETRQKLPEHVSALVERETSIEGTLSVMEKPHIGRDGKNFVSPGPDFSYQVRTGGKEFNVRFADDSSPVIKTGSVVNVNGVGLENYVVARQGGDISTLQESPKQDNLGVQKLLLVFTHPKGGKPMATVKGELERELKGANDIIKEMSYGKASLEWKYLEPFELEEALDTDLVQKIKSELNEYSRILWFDQRNCGACGSVGKTGFEIDSKKYLLSISFYSSSRPHARTIVHELGHNFGVWHANFLDCNGKTFGAPEECHTVHYGDAYDEMGGEGHYNAPHKETIGWIEDRVQEITANGTYSISAFEDGKLSNLPLALKVPRKFDESGKEADFYYLEYRTARGSDTEVVSKYMKENGPQVRLAWLERGFAGGGDTHMLDITPDNYPLNDGIALGKTFTASDGTTIKTIGIDKDKATVEVTLTQKRCKRQDLGVRVLPAKFNYKSFTATYFTVELDNNDESICSEREVYFTLEGKTDGGHVALVDGSGVKRLGIVMKEENKKFGITKLAPQTKYAGTLEVYIQKNEREAGLEEYKFSVKGKNDEKLAEARFTVFSPEEETKTIWPKKDFAKRFLYQAYGGGYYVLDEDGKIHSYGQTNFTTDNARTIREGNGKAIAILNNYYYITNYGETSQAYLGILAIDSMGGIKEIGSTYLNKPAEKELKKVKGLSCGIVRDFKSGDSYAQYLFLDAYGAVAFSPRTPKTDGLNECRNWEGKTNYYRPGEDHARMLQTWMGPVKAGDKNDREIVTGYYILSKDGTIYACGNAKVEYTKLKEQFTPSGERAAVSFALDQKKGIWVLDSYGKVYTSGTAEHLGDLDLGRNYARDIQLIPGNDNAVYSGYGILTGDGEVQEFRG